MRRRNAKKTTQPEQPAPSHWRGRRRRDDATPIELPIAPAPTKPVDPFERLVTFAVAASVQGHSFRVIARNAWEQWGESVSACRRALDEGLLRLEKEHRGSFKTSGRLKLVQRERVIGVIARLMEPQAEKRDYRTLVRYEELLARIDGTLAPTKVEGSVQHEHAVVGVVSNLGTERLAELREEARKRVAARMLPPVVIAEGTAE
jgi:hypothetical protein